MFHKVSSGFRVRAKLKYFTSFPAQVDGETIDLTINRLNRLAEIDPTSVDKLLRAIFGKAKNRGRIIRAIAPRCAVYPLY